MNPLKTEKDSLYLIQTTFIAVWNLKNLRNFEYWANFTVCDRKMFTSANHLNLLAMPNFALIFVIIPVRRTCKLYKSVVLKFKI